MVNSMIYFIDDDNECAGSTQLFSLNGYSPGQITIPFLMP